MRKKKVITWTVLAVMVFSLAAWYFVNEVRLDFDLSSVESVTIYPIQAGVFPEKKEINDRAGIKTVADAIESIHIWKRHIDPADEPDGGYGYGIIFHLDDSTNREYSIYHSTTFYNKFNNVSAGRGPYQGTCSDFKELRELWNSLE